MAILIKGLRLPKIEGNKGIKAEIRQLDGKLELGIMTGGYWCSQEWTYYPITELPSHGRLIDADDIEHISVEWELGDIARIIAPTIIEAEEATP